MSLIYKGINKEKVVSASKIRSEQRRYRSGESIDYGSKSKFSYERIT
jgi:hypothetical protein